MNGLLDSLFVAGIFISKGIQKHTNIMSFVMITPGFQVLNVPTMSLHHKYNGELTVVELHNVACPARVYSGLLQPSGWLYLTFIHSLPSRVAIMSRLIKRLIGDLFVLFYDGEKSR